MKFNDGIHTITSEQYHESEGISRSMLMLLNKSPYHFWYNVLSGKNIKKEPTPSMILGSLFHTILLEPDKLKEEYIVSPKIDRRTSKGKEEWDAFLLQSQGKIIITQEQLNKGTLMAESISEHEMVKMLLANSVFESSLYWTDKETGIQFKSRPDIWSSKMVVDLKTISNDAILNFKKSALSYGYYLQAAMAFEACKSLGKPFDMFVILACEKEPPYAPCIYMMNEEGLQFGINQFNNYKRKLRECFDSNQWEGYTVKELGVPHYAVSTIDEEE